MAYIPEQSIIAVQSDPANFHASVTGTVTIRNLPSVSGTVGASLIGMLPEGTRVLGSVATLQGTNPWLVSFGNSSIFSTQQGTLISSVVNSNPSSLLTGASIFGMLPAGTQVLGSIATLQGTNPWIVNFANSSVLATQQGTNISSVINSTPSSLLTGSSIFGQLPAGTATLGSVVAYQGVPSWNVSGSVVAFNVSTNASFIGVSRDSSIISVPSGSVITVFQAPSIVGTYAEDAAHTSADKGLFVMGVRNDNTASFVSANTEYTPMGVDSAGRSIIKPFSSEDGTIISYTGSVVSASVTLIKSSSIGLRSYITDFMATNTGSVAQLVTFQDGSTSVLGYTIAPAGGGSNAIGWAIPMKTAPSQDLSFKITGTSSVIYLTVKGYQAP